MTAKLVASIAFKIFAIWLLIRSILIIPEIWQGYLSLRGFWAPEHVSIFWPVIIFVSFAFASILAIIVLWKLGNKLIRDVPDTSEKSNAAGLEVGFLQILGVYFFVTSLGKLPAYLMQYLYSEAYDNQIKNGLWMFAVVFQLVVGLLLVAKADFWFALLRKIREYNQNSYNK